MLLRQVVAGDADPHAMLEHLAIDAMMVASPRQLPGRGAGDRLVRRAHAAVELQRVAAHEAARGVGLVELLAPQVGDGCTPAVQRLLDIARDHRPRVQHQVLADQPG
jgi:hypothetical protein